jgi:hypothetical protein
LIFFVNFKLIDMTNIMHHLIRNNHKIGSQQKLIK